MQKHILNRWAVMTLLLAAMPLVSSEAFAECCPTGGIGAPKTANGLGQSFPQAADLAADPEWQIYEFERGGIRYIQINDSTGKVRAAVGRIDDVLWVMPIGVDVDRVALDAAPNTTAQRKLLYRAEGIEVILYRAASGDSWVIRQSVVAY